MKYIFVDKNFLIPIITEYSYNLSLNQLINSILNKKDNYIKNIYIVVTNNDIVTDIIYAKNNFIYKNSSKNNIVTEIKLFNYTKLNLNYSFNNNTFINNYYDYDYQQNINLNNNSLNLEIIEKNNNNINIKNEICNEKETLNDKLIITNDEDDKKQLLLKTCEEVLELYKLEEHKMKKIELDLKSKNHKIEKLKKQQNDKLFDNLLKVKNDYRTWKKLKYVINDNDDLLKDFLELETTEIKNIPILFLAKYNYFEKLQEDIESSNILININNMNLEKVFMENSLNNTDNIIKFSEKYTKTCKNLHYKFDNDWDYLEEQTDNNITSSLFR
jgi:hypothetical protein